MQKKLDFETFKKEAFLNKEFTEEYEKLKPEFVILEQKIKARKQALKDRRELD